VLKKITSSLGEQEFFSFRSGEELIQIIQDEQKNHRACFASILPWWNNYNLLFDDHGTGKFYCHHLIVH
jgi:hypothetical protein